MTRFDLIVEEAGCASCAERVRSALAPLGEVERVEIDEPADLARVTLSSDERLDESRVAAALAAASEGAGHAYRVRPGSWRPATTVKP